jgi:hypothetical protein
VEEGRVDLGGRGDDLRERRPQHGEHVAHLAGQHPRLEVVEERGVRAVGPFEALDIAPLELEVRSQVGEERGEVVRPSRLDPGVVTARGLARHLRAQVGRHPPGLLPVAPRHADEAAVVGVVGEPLDERLARVQEPAHLGVDEPLVRDAAERRELLGPRVRAPRRHRHPLVPPEHARREPQVGALGQPEAELVERSHGPDPRESARCSVGAPQPTTHCRFYRSRCLGEQRICVVSAPPPRPSARRAGAAPGREPDE